MIGDVFEDLGRTLVRTLSKKKETQEMNPYAGPIPWTMPGWMINALVTMYMKLPFTIATYEAVMNGRAMPPQLVPIAPSALRSEINSLQKLHDAGLLKGDGGFTSADVYVSDLREKVSALSTEWKPIRMKGGTDLVDGTKLRVIEYTDDGENATHWLVPITNPMTEQKEKEQEKKEEHTEEEDDDTWSWGQDWDDDDFDDEEEDDDE